MSTADGSQPEMPGRRLKRKLGEQVVAALLKAKQCSLTCTSSEPPRDILTISCQDQDDDSGLHKGAATQPQLRVDNLELKALTAGVPNHMHCRKLQQCRPDASC